MFRSDQMDWARVGWGDLIPGLTLLLAGAGMGIAHYLFGAPIHEGRGNGALASPALILATTMVFVSCGMLSVGLGAWLIAVSRRKVR